jgi:hypothetical protein
MACARRIIGPEGVARHLAAVWACVLMVGTSVLAQDAPSGPAPSSDRAQGESAPAGNRPGFLEALGRMFSGSQEAPDPSVKSTGDALGNLGSQAIDAARDTANTIAAVPGARIVTGRQMCPFASNGAPDCQQGVEVLCKSQGFNAGKVLEIKSGVRCSAKAWVDSGFKKKEACRTETYVTRGACL